MICCSLAGLKMSLRTGFCCRNGAIAALKLELGQQRLSNSYLKTGAGKAEVEQ